MYLQSKLQDLPCIFPALFPWFAIRTKSNQEKIVAAILNNKELEVYLPTYRVRRRWSDRVVETEQPLFSSYVFCRLDIVKRLAVLTTPGVLGILGFGNQPVSIPEREIQSVKAVLNSGTSVEPCAFLREGQRIRIKQGALVGQEGVLLQKKNECRFVISVAMLQRSLSIEIDHGCIEAF